MDTVIFIEEERACNHGSINLKVYFVDDLWFYDTKYVIKLTGHHKVDLKIAGHHKMHL